LSLDFLTVRVYSSPGSITFSQDPLSNSALIFSLGYTFKALFLIFLPLPRDDPSFLRSKPLLKLSARVSPREELLPAEWEEYLVFLLLVTI